MSGTEKALVAELRHIRKNPVESLVGLREGFSQFESSMNFMRYIYIAKIVGAYYKIVEDNAEKSRFIEICVKEGQKPNIIKKNLLLAVFKYTLKADSTGPMYERARIYAGAMRSLVELETDPALIPEMISKADGVEELYAQHRAKLNAKKDGELDNESEFDNLNGEAEDDDRDDRDDRDDVDNVDTPISKPSPPPKRFKISFDPRKDLKVSFQDERDLEEILKSKQPKAMIEVDLEYPKGEPVRVIFRDVVFN